MKIKKLETRENWVCEVNGHSYVRTEIEWRTDEPITITWHLNEDNTQGFEPLTDEQLEKLFWENNTKTNNPVLVELPLNEEVKRTFNDQDMINFLQSVFEMEGFDYEKSYDDFISRRKNTKEELPKTQIDYSDCNEPIINDWLEENGNPKIAKQVEEEAEELLKIFGQELSFKCVENIIKAIPDASDDDSPYNHELVFWQKVQKLIINLSKKNTNKEKMENILTAKEYISKNLIDYWQGGKAQYAEEDVERAMIDFANIMINFKQSAKIDIEQELPKTEIDWSGFPKSTQEQVGFTEPNIIDEWLDKNGNPEIGKQVEEEVAMSWWKNKQIVQQQGLCNIYLPNSFYLSLKKNEIIFIFNEENKNFKPKQETLEKTGAIAAILCEHLEAKEQAMFISGFQECAKWQKNQDDKNVKSLLEALQQIATGEIVGESKNYKDSLYIVKEIAKEAIEEYLKNK